MNRNKARVAAAAVVVAVILFGIAISNRATRPTFAISHAIETLKEYPSVRLEGAIPGNLDLLADPAAGIPVGGMTRQEACEALLRSVYESVIAGDVGQLRQLAPLAAKLDDAVLQSIILREGRGDRIVELLRIGRIAATGHNRLGPVEAVPVAVRLQNGAKVEEKILVQFRQIEGRQSCVFHGPYGFPREIE